jgi:osmotically-inducible protein OsmY
LQSLTHDSFVQIGAPIEELTMNGKTAIVLASSLAAGIAAAQSPPQAPFPDPSEAARPREAPVRGPSDADIALRVQQQLTQQIAAPGLSAEILDGVATLRGTVASESERDRAARIARRVDGVTRVKNELVVNAAAAAAHADAHDVPPVDFAVKAKLKENAALVDEDIDVRERDGVVTLAGRVPSVDEKELAGKLAAEVQGVSEVHNQIEIR